MNEQELRRREAALREKEAELARREQQLAAAAGQQNIQPGSAPNVRPGDAQPGQPPAGSNAPSGDAQPPAAPDSVPSAGTPDPAAPGNPPGNAKERLYDRIHIPLWLLDTIIIGCIIAFFVVVAVGALKGHGML